ncbi:hypothetical protein BDR07DRAFT_571392 [Suillus spraguei]|nr:hypothetical protein BDR07DRAFT_571392 [Suillus spraguei]
MPFSQPISTSILAIHSAFTRLQRSIKIRMSSLLSTRTQKSSITSRAVKRRSLLPLLKLSSSSLYSWSSRDTEPSAKRVDSDSSAESTTPDVIATPAASPISASTLTFPPSLGQKITDRFWPEEDPEHNDQDEISGNGRLLSPMIVNVLSPPPYHRRAPNVIVHQDNIVSSDNYPSHYKNQHDSRPMRFPF